MQLCKYECMLLVLDKDNLVASRLFSVLQPCYWATGAVLHARAVTSLFNNSQLYLHLDMTRARTPGNYRDAWPRLLILTVSFNWCQVPSLCCV